MLMHSPCSAEGAVAPHAPSVRARPSEPTATVAKRAVRDISHHSGSLVFGHTPCVPQEVRSEEHTSELQSRGHLVCRLLLEKKKNSRAAHPARRHARDQRARDHPRQWRRGTTRNA